MTRKIWAWVLAFAMMCVAGAYAENNVSIKGKVMGPDGKAARGVTITAIDEENQSTISVFTNAMGEYELNGLSDGDLSIRARQIGLLDEYEDISAGHGGAVGFTMEKATGEDLDDQRPGSNRMSMLKFDNEADALNFRMMCTYCHQVGTRGFRTPEEPVDWEVMVTRMDGFGGLYKHTQETLVERLLEAYGPDAEKNWPAYTPPEPPKGVETTAIISEWSMGKENAAMVHDLEPGIDGKMWIVDMTNDLLASLDPETGERKNFSVPGGATSPDDTARKGPHSLEADSDGNMWITLALSGQMGKLDVSTGEYTIVSGNEAPRTRGAYPHSLRIDQNTGKVWYTDAGMGVFSLDPSENNEVKFYKLLAANEAVGAGRGESRGSTPYGIDIAPNGHVWYSKLNGQRIGRIIPETGEMKEWAPPVHGPRRLHVAPNGIVWVPGWASGDIASFDPETEEWEVHELPDGEYTMPYALNIHPNGDVWVCGTGNDTMIRYVPETGETDVFRMPTRVTYTREVEFGSDGAVWVCNSNYPTRHIENMYGSLIKIEVPGVTDVLN